MANLHVIIGEDDYLVGETVKRIVGDGQGLETIDSLNSTNEDLQLADLREADASFSTPPFLEPRKVTWWKNVHFLPQSGGKGASAAVKAGLEKFAKKLASGRLPENQHFILSGPRLLMTSIVAKTLKAAAEVVSLSSGKPWEAARAAAGRVEEAARDMNLKFERGALEAFVARVGVDARSLMSELGKMRDYLGPENHTVTAADVAEVTSQGVGVDPAPWAITDAVGSRDIDAALMALRAFEGDGGFPVFMTTVLEKFFRQMAEQKDAQAHGREAAATEGMSPWAVKKQKGFLEKWSLLELRSAWHRFMSLREKAVSSSGSTEILVTTELVRVMRPHRRA